jgi:hypothetical protein
MTTTQWFKDRIAVLEAQIVVLEMTITAAQAGIESDAEKAAELDIKVHLNEALAVVEQLKQELQDARDELDAIT